MRLQFWRRRRDLVEFERFDTGPVPDGHTVPTPGQPTIDQLLGHLFAPDTTTELPVVEQQQAPLLTPGQRARSSSPNRPDWDSR